MTKGVNTMAELGNNSKAGLVSALNGALADTMALYFKTKNFDWHVAGYMFGTDLSPNKRHLHSPLNQMWTLLRP